MLTNAPVLFDMKSKFLQVYGFSCSRLSRKPSFIPLENKLSFFKSNLHNIAYRWTFCPCKIIHLLDLITVKGIKFILTTKNKIRKK